MKPQGIVEVIVYLLEKVVTQHHAADQETIRKKLAAAGFAHEEITTAFAWLKELLTQQHWYAAIPYNSTNKTLRVFTPEESYKIKREAQSFILALEFAGVLDTKMREIVINQLLQLKQREVNLNDAKWVVLLVLLSKSNRNVQELHNYLITTMAQEV